MNNFDSNSRELDIPFAVFCRFCRKKFKTGVSLRKHYELKHHEGSLFETTNIFVDQFGNRCHEPKATALGNDAELQEYLEWLSALLERINVSLVPDHPGEYYGFNISLFWKLLLTRFGSFLDREVVSYRLFSSTREVFSSHSASLGKSEP